MAGLAWVISLLDGSRDRAQVIQAAVNRGVPAETAERVLALLASAGALDDFPAATLRVLSQALRTRLAAELATVSLARGDGDGGARTLARRLAAQVRVDGSGRVADGVASILTTSGVSCVMNPDPAREQDDSRGTAATVPSTAQPTGTQAAAARRRPTTPATAPPDGASPGIAQPTSAPAATARPGRARPPAGRSASIPPATAPARTAPPRHPRPDLAVLTGHRLPELQDDLMRDQVPHLVASASEAIGIVGPLVMPGHTACLRCLDLLRTDHDPAWPLILAQLAGRTPSPLACDAALAAAVAAQAAAQALAFIDGASSADAVANGTLELVLPGWQWRRRTWPPHPECSCGSHARGATR
jgi:bacteriocin biosynthesis cyclodehydratase domain-containing protein